MLPQFGVPPKPRSATDSPSILFCKVNWSLVMAVMEAATVTVSDFAKPTNVPVRWNDSLLHPAILKTPREREVNRIEV